MISKAKRKTAKVLSKLSPRAEAASVLSDIRAIIETARERAHSAANLSLVAAYWKIGNLIDAKLMGSPRLADYGNRFMETLSRSLVKSYGKGFSPVNLWDMRRFHEMFQILQTPSEESPGRKKLQTASEVLDLRIAIDFNRHVHLTWSHYRILLAQSEPRARRFYFDMTATQRWPIRQLNREIRGSLFERVALSTNTQKLAKIEKRKQPHVQPDFRGFFKDPYLLDFLGLPGAFSERDLESSILANLQQFLIELGGDFCFVRRQYPMRIDDEDYFLDLLFYHRGLRCLIAIDLKIGPFSAGDKGQMDLYLAWLKRHEWRKGENEPVGLILCTSKRQQHVEMLLAEGPHRLLVSEYRTRLPAKKLLEERLKVYSKLLSNQDFENTESI